MKTKEQWFDELPEPIRQMAINNTPVFIRDIEQSSLQDALLGAFKWSETKQGFVFWRLVWENEYKKAIIHLKLTPLIR